MNDEWLMVPDSQPNHNQAHTEKVPKQFILILTCLLTTLRVVNKDVSPS